MRRTALGAGARLVGIVVLTGAALAGCRQEQPGAPPRVHHRRHQPPPAPGPGKLIVLPDSAILATAGSTEEQLANFLASPEPAPRTFRFTGTEFAEWADRPNPATLRTMYVLGQILRAYPAARVTLVGYTDSVGTPAQNQQLAAARVRHLAGLLQQAGVRADRITTEARGATDYIGDNATEQGRARNRRIELVVTAK